MSEEYGCIKCGDIIPEAKCSETDTGMLCVCGKTGRVLTFQELLDFTMDLKTKIDDEAAVNIYEEIINDDLGLYDDYTEVDEIIAQFIDGKVDKNE